MRFDAGSGLVAAALILTGFWLAGQAPAPAAPAAELARHLMENRSRILAGDVLVGAGAMFYLWFLAALRQHLRSRSRPEPTLSSTAFAAGVAAMTVVVAGVGLQAGLVLDEATVKSAAVVRLGFDGYNALITIAGFGFAMTVAAAAGSASRSGALSRALRASGWATAALQLMTIPGLIVTRGFFAPAAPMPVIAFWALTAWSIAVSVFLIRHGRRGD
jgi:hypothetical protein